MREIMEFLILSINYRKCEKMGTLSANFYIEHGSNETPTKADHRDDPPRGPRCRGLVGYVLRFGLRTQRRLPSLYRREQRINRGTAERARSLRSFAQPGFYRSDHKKLCPIASGHTRQQLRF